MFAELSIRQFFRLLSGQVFDFRLASSEMTAVVSRDEFRLPALAGFCFFTIYGEKGAFSSCKGRKKVLNSPQMVNMQQADELGRVIRSRREALRVTLQQLSDLTGVGINTLSRLERGADTVSLRIVLLVLQTLGLKWSITPEQN